MASSDNRSFYYRRFDRRVTEIWSLAADDPELALSRARALRQWLEARPMSGEAEAYRKLFTGQLSELIRLLTA